jgi:hypothetical protein
MKEITMKNLSINFTQAVVLAIIMTSCATPTPQLDEKFGEAVNSAKALQIINPDAGLNEQSPDGMGGKAASGAMDRYHDSYKTPQLQTNVFTIGIGESGAGGR